MIIKYFGKNEYTEFENTSENNISELNTSLSTILSILDDFIIHKKIAQESQNALNTTEKVCTIQKIKKKFTISNRKNSWLVSWRAWGNFAEEVGFGNTSYTKKDLSDALGNTDLILVLSDLCFSRIDISSTNMNALEKYLPDNIYILIGICNQILSHEYDPAISKDAACDAIYELLWVNPDTTTDYAEVYDENDDVESYVKSYIENCMNDEHTYCEQKNKFTSERILETFEKVKNESKK